MKFEFTEQEASYILNALARMPYAEVAQLIQKMQQQAQAQETIEKQESTES